MGDACATVAIYALDVGQGDATFILAREPGDGAILFDCNDPYVCERFVVDHGIHSLHNVVVSHLDRDHIRGLLPFLKWFLETHNGTVGHVYVGLDRDRERVSKTAAELIDAVLGWESDRRFALHAPQREDVPRVIHRGGSWEASLILPRYSALLRTEMDGEDEPNRCSVALRVTCGSRAVIIGGDVPLVSWESLEPGLIEACAVRAPHHGGGIRESSPTWSEGSFYEATKADVVIVSAGSNNDYGHPTDEHVNGIGVPGRRLVCTQLTPRCHDDLAGVRAEMLRTASRVTYAPYRHRYGGGSRVRRPQDEVPCAGSISVELFEDGRVNYEPPRPGWHDQLIDRVRLVRPRCR